MGDSLINLFSGSSCLSYILVHTIINDHILRAKIRLPLNSNGRQIHYFVVYPLFKGAPPPPTPPNVVFVFFFFFFFSFNTVMYTCRVKTLNSFVCHCSLLASHGISLCPASNSHIYIYIYIYHCTLLTIHILSYSRTLIIL